MVLLSPAEPPSPSSGADEEDPLEEAEELSDEVCDAAELDPSAKTGAVKAEQPTVSAAKNANIFFIVEIPFSRRRKRD
ncbi:hypothetical protein [Anaerotruncus colihominis]|uniref:hypothetical protein n=1 Tax=Anaerotruncus colihominis TaxID=169435 RepID=UPI001362BB2D|nr:hypothetical protein [Anaerotruncus colihominis]MCR2025407.1 hypothetical protein [Anaerotruncus colihominis]